jgi:hypothetical protein
MLTSKALRPRAVQPDARRQPPVPTLPTPAKTAPSGELRGSLQDQAERRNPLRRMAFYSSLGFLFLRLTGLSELLLYYTKVKFYLLYVFVPLAIIGTLTTGGIGRTFRQNASKYWMAFFFWMVLATPFSFWKGDSIAVISGYGRFAMVMLFIVAGLAMTWKEIRLLFYTIAAAALVNLGTAQLFAKLDNGGRITLEASGNMGNSNDLAAQFLLVLPFLAFVAMDRARNAFLRIALLPPLAYGAWVVLGTGSRGCMIALGAVFLFVLWRASPAHRIATLVAGIALAVMIPLFLPGSVLTRLGSLVKEEGAIRDNSGESAEALESSAARAYLLKQSLLYTFEHPVFGVGPGQFSNFEGNEKTAEGKHGQWHATHNFLTQVSSECGIPALIFMLLGLSSAILLVNRTYWMARRKGFRDIVNACFCYELAMVGYLCSIVFLAQAYGFYLPTMVGLAIAMSVVAMREMSAQEPSAVGIAPALPFALR